MTIDPIVDRIRKVKALCNSPNAGEAKAARRAIVELRRKHPTYFNASAKERARHAAHQPGEKIIGPVETALRAQIEAIRPLVAPAIMGLAGLPGPSDWRVEKSIVIATQTWPALLDRMDAIQRYRDWQFDQWEGTTKASLNHCEQAARRLMLWVELVEDAADRLRQYAAEQRSAA